MKVRKLIVKYVALFVTVFSLGIGFTLSMAGNAAACSLGTCHHFYESCPAESPCPGNECFANHNKAPYVSGDCCGTVDSWTCF